MRILVTGATGFIGSNLVRYASHRGHHVVGVKRKGSKPRIDTESHGIEWMESDLSGITASELSSTDAVVHLASYGVVTGSNDWEECFKVNVIDFLSLMKKAIVSGVRRYIVCGSCFEYGNSGDRYDFIPVTAPLEPTTAYASSKASASMLSYSLGVEKNLEMIIARPFHVYGEGEDTGRFYPQLVQKGLNGEDLDMTLGEQVRDFQPVGECCDQILELLEYTGVKNGKPEFFNLGTGTPRSLREFAQLEWKRMGATGAINFGSIPYRNNEVFRYVPEVNLPF